MIDQELKQAEEKMKKAVEVTREEFVGVRTGRASPALVQRITVDYYGASTPLQQLAGVAVPDPRSLAITPYDRNAIAVIEKAIQASDLGITPSNDGQTIRLNFPPLTEERRKELIKVVRDRAEHGRVAVRNVRRHAKDEIEREEKAGEVSQDEMHRGEQQLQKLTDRFVAEIDDMLQRKEAELMEV
ncbi:MAG TPA: ribosome recycling factor [Actinomycetota bacterium]